MKKIFIFFVLVFCLVLSVLVAVGIEAQASETNPADIMKAEYRVGVDDILDINIIQPDQLGVQCPVVSDGSISFPYIGSVQVKGMTLAEIQHLLEEGLSDGYMKYPVVAVSLRESRSRKFFVYGEIIRPGSYMMEDNMTVLKSISLAGGFTKYASSSSVKVLRPFKDRPGYESIKVNMNAVMNGDSKKDVVIQSGDVVVVSEGIF